MDKVRFQHFGREDIVTDRSTALAGMFMSGLADAGHRDPEGEDYEDGKNKEQVFEESQEDISESRNLDRRAGD